ncbi:flagellar associated protein [Reticulomyxa filosa]|uniref:Flagellar associated protein n=1 Tax=Reticulomyxa filosa TaxID=46433 RepID=X6NQV7_RETFI|nr:flagellar associated protein [Reticulomyxa filosa]|eukprot:ETO28690.1 flagellar associated protein [Reticulomyxa filosa]
MAQAALQRTLNKMGNMIAMGMADDMSVASTVNKTSISSYRGVPMEESDAESSESPYKFYRVMVKPHSQLQFSLRYQPLGVEKCQILLPIVLAGQAEFEPLKRFIIAHSIQPILSLSTREITFREVIGKKFSGSKIIKVLRADKVESSPYTADIAVKNEESYPVHFRLELDKTAKKDAKKPSKCWQIAPYKNEIVPGDIVLIKISFAPTDDILHQNNLNLFIVKNDKKDENNPIDKKTPKEKPYFQIRLNGQATFPKLSFENEIFLPPVPLHVRSTKLMLIYNSGYDGFDLKYEIAKDCPVEITVKFPDGTWFEDESIPIEISFVSTIATAFTTIVDLIDVDGHCFPLTVNGLSSNSVLSNQSYWYGHECQIARPDELSMPQIAEISQDNNHDEKKDDTKIAAMCQLLPQVVPPNILDDISMLLMFLESNGYMQFPNGIVHFPSDIVEGNGEPVFKLLKFFTGKKIFGTTKYTKKTKKMELQNIKTLKQKITTPKILLTSLTKI